MTCVVCYSTSVFFESDSCFHVPLRFRKVDTIPPIFLFSVLLEIRAFWAILDGGYSGVLCIDYYDFITHEAIVRSSNRVQRR